MLRRGFGGCGRGQAGQAAAEFLLALVLAIGLLAFLMQVASFELDVFNKTARARYETIKKARDRQAPQNSEQNVPEEINHAFEGEPIRDIAPLLPWFQPDEIGDLYYSERRFYIVGGTENLADLGTSASDPAFPGQIEYTPLCLDNDQDDVPDKFNTIDLAYWVIQLLQL